MATDPSAESRTSITGATVTTLTGNDGVVWEKFDYDDAVVYQRDCPGCDHGLLLAPARLHARCGGSGYLVGVPLP